MSNDKKTKLSPPWYTYLSEIKAMFVDDPEVEIMFDDDEKEIKLFVSREAKANALAAILKPEQDFGNVTLKITVVPPNEEKRDVLDDFEDAFRGNSAMQAAFSLESPLGTHRFVGFKKKVVQFYNDQLDDPYGNRSTLYQDIAKNIFVDGLAVDYYTVEHNNLD